MSLPIVYRKERERTIASYNYIDIANGTGMVKFFGTIADGSDHILTANAFLSGGGTIAENIEVNIDLNPFNLPRTVKGSAFINFWVNKNTNDGHSVDFQFKKVSSTTTNISSNITSQIFTGSGITGHLIEVPLTETNFKKGDILRLTVKVLEAGGTASLILASSGSNPLEVYVPFKIDL